MNTLFFSLIEHQPAETALPNVSTIGTKLVGGWVSSADNWQQTSDLVMLAQKPCSCQTRYHLAYAMNTLSLFQAVFFLQGIPKFSRVESKKHTHHQCPQMADVPSSNLSFMPWPHLVPPRAPPRAPVCRVGGPSRSSSGVSSSPRTTRRRRAGPRWPSSGWDRRGKPIGEESRGGWL